MVAVATSPVLVGRSDELDLLARFWRGALDGAPKGIIVSGEAGLGKSRLLREFARGLGPEPVVAVGYCDQLGTLGTPFAPVREAMLALVDQFGEDVVRQRLGPGRLRDLSSLVPVLDADDEAPLRPGAVHTAVRDTLVLLSELRPILVVLEDVHWADAATLDLVRAVVSRFSKGRVVLALTCRDDEVPADNALGQFLSEFDRLSGVQRIDLQRLSAGQVAEQAAAILGPDHPHDALELARRSDGVPFLVEELVAAGDGPIPGSLRGVVLARYQQMSPRTRAVLREVAVGGGAVRHALLERVHDGGPQDLAMSLEEAVAAHVLVVREDDYVFRHELTQEAVADEVLPGERARLHRRYADELQQAGGEAAAIAHHRLALGANGVGALTPRERQVLALIAEGLTNRQIGRRLFISEKTASVHVSAILRKLGVASRTEAAVRAVAE